LLAVTTGVLFLVGGFSDASFLRRLGTRSAPVPFMAGWLQMAAFAATVVLGAAAFAATRTDLHGSAMEGDRS